MSDTATTQIEAPEPEFSYPGDQEKIRESIEQPPGVADSAPDGDVPPAEPSEDVETTEPEQAEPETTVITKNGVEYTIPADLREDFLFHGDYTKKSQALAEQRRAHEAEIEAHQARVKVQQEHLADLGALHAIDHQIGQLAPITQGQVQVTAEEYQQAVNGLVLLQQRREGLVRQVDQRVAEAQREAGEQVAKRTAEARDWAAANIQNWTPEKENNVRAFVEQQGVPGRLIEQAIQAAPATLGIMHLAMIGKQFLDSQRTRAKPKPVPQMKKVGKGGSAPAPKLENARSAEEFARIRYEQLRAKQAR